MGSESIEEFDVLEDCQEKQLTPDVGADEVLFVVVVVFSCSLSSSTLELLISELLRVTTKEVKQDRL